MKKKLGVCILALTMGLTNIQAFAQADPTEMELIQKAIESAKGKIENGNVLEVVNEISDLSAAIRRFSNHCEGLESIEIKSFPTKTEYMLGEELDITGLVVEGKYKTGEIKPINIIKSDITGFSSSTGGTKTLTITLNDTITATFNINVKLPNIASVYVQTDYTPKNQQYTGMGYNLNYAKVPNIVTFVNNDGSITVCSEDSKDNSIVHINEFDSNSNLKNSLKITKELPMFGSFTKDNNGNYYIVYGKEVEEEDKTTDNIILVKYDSNGTKLLEYKTNGGQNNAKLPFKAGSCRIEITNNGSKVAVYYARQMFKSSDGLNHQASGGFVVTTNTLTKTDDKIPYSSHSFNEFILPIENEFVIIDHGDAYPRGFQIKRTSDGKGILSFKIKGNVGANPVFSQLGGIEATTDGYIFLGASEKSNVVGSNTWHNESHNVFVQILDKNLATASNPIWLTDYTDAKAENVVYPKLVKINDNKYVILWEQRAESGNAPYQGLYMAVVDAQGNKLVDNTKVSNTIKLNGYDTLRYNDKTNRIYWTTAGDNGLNINSIGVN